MLKYSFWWCLLPLCTGLTSVAFKNPEYKYYMRYENLHLYCNVTTHSDNVNVSWHNRFCDSYDQCHKVMDQREFRSIDEKFYTAPVVAATEGDVKTHSTYLRLELARSDEFLCKACVGIDCKNATILLFAMPNFLYPGDKPDPVDKNENWGKSCTQYENETATCTHKTIREANLTLACRESKDEMNNKVEFDWYLQKEGEETMERLNETLPKSHLRINESVATRNSYYSLIELINITMTMNGSYICKPRRDGVVDDTTSNEGGITEVVHKVYVIPDRKPTIQSNSSVQQDVITFSTDEESKITCEVDGVPDPDVTWYFKKSGATEMKKLDRTENPKQFYSLKDPYKLWIRKFAEELEGEYTCNALNREGNANATVRVTLPPSKASIPLTILFVFLLLMLMLFIGLHIYRYFKEKKLEKELSLAGLLNFVDGAPDRLNPDLNLADQADCLPYNRNFEFARHKLKMGKQLGQGAFGVVLKAEADGIIEDDVRTTVAVKMVKQNMDLTHVKALASELKIMVHLGRHLNVVNLLGACTDNIRDLLVIVEFCQHGNLHSYLQHNRKTFKNQVNPETGIFDPSITCPPPPSTTLKYTSVRFSNETTTAGSASQTNRSDTQTFSPHALNSDEHDDVGLDTGSDGLQLNENECIPLKGSEKSFGQAFTTQDLICWSFQVARGMEYLANRKVLHGDLAARNILLADRNVVKISDFGLSKNMYNYNCANYLKKTKGMLPIRWMALEAIRDGKFSTQTDVWAYGIVLWEFFTLAKTPYPLIDDAERLFRKLEKGYRMEKPQYATNELYEIMMACWDEESSNRPAFSVLIEKMSHMLEDSVRKHYMELNDPYLEHNKEYFTNQEDYLQMLFNPSVMYTNNLTGGGPSAEGGQSYVSMGGDKVKEKLQKMAEDYMSMEGKTINGDGYAMMQGKAAGDADAKGDANRLSLTYTNMEGKKEGGQKSRYVDFPINRPVSVVLPEPAVQPPVQEKANDAQPKPMGRYVDFPINKPVEFADQKVADDPLPGWKHQSDKSEPKGIHYVNIPLDK